MIVVPDFIAERLKSDGWIILSESNHVFNELHHNGNTYAAKNYTTHFGERPGYIWLTPGDVDGEYYLRGEYRVDGGMRNAMETCTACFGGKFNGAPMSDVEMLIRTGNLIKSMQNAFSQTLGARLLNADTDFDEESTHAMA